MSVVKWKLRRIGGGWAGTITLPVGPCSVKATGRGPTKATALSRASGLAEKVLNDPLLQAAMPPQAALALRGVKQLSSVAKQGQGAVKAVTKALKSKTLRKVGKALSSLF
jgi:hypothetical protein